MTVICVDDEKLLLQHMVSMCRQIPEVQDVHGFSRGGEALAWLEKNTCDLALLDINMPDMDGIILAKMIRERRTNTDIVFVTGYGQYAMDAWSIHARGYILKPVSLDRLKEEIAYIQELRQFTGRQNAHIEVKTFGNFDVLVDGEPVHFQRAKAKELLALLVERQGESLSREEAYRILWEERPYDRPAQKTVDVIFRSLRATLEEYGISEILVHEHGAIRLNPRLVSCDMYRFLLGDVAAINEYRGEYMSAYPWASLQEAYLERRIENLQ